MMARLIEGLGLVPANLGLPRACGEISDRMAKAGFRLSTVTQMAGDKPLISVKFIKHDGEVIHAVGQSDFTQVFQACLAEAIRRYRAGVLARDGAQNVRHERDGDGDRGVLPEL